MEQLFCYKHIDIEIRNNAGYTAFEIIEQATRNLRFIDALKAKPLWRAFAAFGKYRNERDEARRMARKHRRLDMDLFPLSSALKEKFVPSAPVLWRRGGVHDFDGSDDRLLPFDYSYWVQMANFCERGQYKALKFLMRKRGQQLSVPWQNAFAKIIGKGKLLLAVRGFKDNNRAKTPHKNALMREHGTNSSTNTPR